MNLTRHRGPRQTSILFQSKTEPKICVRKFVLIVKFCMRIPSHIIFFIFATIPILLHDDIKCILTCPAANFGCQNLEETSLTSKLPAIMFWFCTKLIFFQRYFESFQRMQYWELIQYHCAFIRVCSIPIMPRNPVSKLQKLRSLQSKQFFLLNLGHKITIFRTCFAKFGQDAIL